MSGRVAGILIVAGAAGAAPVTPAAPGDAGYWLAAELVGPAAARGRALERLAGAASRRDDEAEREAASGSSWVTKIETPETWVAGPGGMPPPPELPGEAVAHVPDIQAALRWVETHAFDEPPPDDVVDPLALRVEAAAVPGGALAELGVHLKALALGGLTPLGEHRPIDWPADPESILPERSTWVTADLVPNAAPIFAAPAPTIPPASERHATIHRRGQLFVVRMLDRCDAQQRCLRWAQVVARDGDRFVPGFVPAFQVAMRRDWVRGEDELPWAILIRSSMDASQARWQLVARARDEALYRTTVTAARATDAFPDARLSVEGDWGTVEVGAAQRFALDATLTPRRGADAEDPPAMDAPPPARSEAR